MINQSIRESAYAFKKAADKGLPYLEASDYLDGLSPASLLDSILDNLADEVRAGRATEEERTIFEIEYLSC